MPYRDADDDELTAEEYADDPDAETLPCPGCRAQIFDDAVRCPACGHYLGASTGKPIWLILGVLMCLAMAVGWIVRAL